MVLNAAFGVKMLFCILKALEACRDIEACECQAWMQYT